MIGERQITDRIIREHFIFSEAMGKRYCRNRAMIPVNKPLLNGNEKKYLSECIDSGWISSEGPFVKRFEDGLARRVNRNVRHCRMQWQCST